MWSGVEDFMNSSGVEAAFGVDDPPAA